MPMPAAPMRGRKNCSRCTRWRPVTDFTPGRRRRRDGSVIDPPQLSAWCEVCQREAARARAARRYARRRDALALAHARNRRLVIAREAYWSPPFARWLEAAQARHGWLLLAEWAGCDEGTLRKLAAREVVDAELVDRLLLAEGNTLLDDLYPHDDLHAGVDELAAAA